MGPARSKAVVGTLAMAYAAVLAFGGAWFGERAAVVIMIGAFVVGFAWLWLLVAPWASRGRGGGPAAPRVSRGSTGQRGS